MPLMSCILGGCTMRFPEKFQSTGTAHAEVLETLAVGCQLPHICKVMSQKADLGGSSRAQWAAWFMKISC